MAEMVERIARELFSQARGPGLKPCGDAWKDYENDARAIIRLMREPTTAMAMAHPMLPCRDVWSLMIDEALK